MSGLLKETVKFTCRNNYYVKLFQNRSCTTKPTSSPPPRKPASSPAVKDVPGLSNKIVAVPPTEVGPGASKQAVYKNPEYFCYHNQSYFEAEVEMMKYRCPQPSNKVPFKQ